MDHAVDLAVMRIPRSHRVRATAADLRSQSENHQANRRNTAIGLSSQVLQQASHCAREAAYIVKWYRLTWLNVQKDKMTARTMRIHAQFSVRAGPV